MSSASSPQDDIATEYQSRSRKAPDTADAHRELADWCREHKLIAEADHHLARVAELDPTDEDAAPQPRAISASAIAGSPATS